MPSEVVVAVALLNFASEPVDEPAGPGSRNAQDTLKVRPPVARKRPVVNHQDVIEGMNNLPLTRNVHSVFEINGRRGDESEAEQVRFVAALPNVVVRW
jgi:hypothetical protein